MHRNLRRSCTHSTSNPEICRKDHAHRNEKPLRCASVAGLPSPGFLRRGHDGAISSRTKVPTVANPKFTACLGHRVQSFTPWKYYGSEILSARVLATTPDSSEAAVIPVRIFRDRKHRQRRDRRGRWKASDVIESGFDIGIASALVAADEGFDHMTRRARRIAVPVTRIASMTQRSSVPSGSQPPMSGYRYFAREAPCSSPSPRSRKLSKTKFPSSPKTHRPRNCRARTWHL